MAIDRVDPSHFVQYINRENIDEETPLDTQVTIHYGKSDAKVNGLASHFLARTARMSMYESNVQENEEKLYGFNMIKDSEVISPQNGECNHCSVIMGFDFGA